jgi:hypothetical protein
MLLLSIEGYRTVLYKAVLVLAWNCAQRVEDIYLYKLFYYNKYGK